LLSVGFGYRQDEVRRLEDLLLDAAEQSGLATKIDRLEAAFFFGHPLDQVRVDIVEIYDDDLSSGQRRERPRIEMVAVEDLRGIALQLQLQSAADGVPVVPPIEHVRLSGLGGPYGA
jgi:hypothetical protein